MTKEKEQELLQLVLKLTGARSIIMLLGNSEMPCSDDVAGRPCEGGHMFDTIYRGVEKRFVGDILHSGAHHSALHVSEAEDEEEKPVNPKVKEAMEKLFGNEEGHGKQGA